MSIIIPIDGEERFQKEFKKLNKRIRHLLIYNDIATFKEFRNKLRNGIDDVNFTHYRNIGAKTDFEIKEFAKKIFKN